MNTLYINFKRQKFKNVMAFNNMEKIESNKVEYNSRNIKESKIEINSIIEIGKNKSNLIIDNELDKYKKEISQKKYMFTIEKITFAIIICIFFVYISMIIYQENAINKIENILLSYYYNTYTRGIMLKIYSELNGIFHDVSGINNQNIVVKEDDLKRLSTKIRRIFFYFRQKYTDYNLIIGTNSLYKEVNLIKLKGHWEEIPFVSKFSSDIDYISHMTYIINLTSTPEFESDIKNFLI